MDKISLAIGIPTINRYDLLKPFLKKYNTQFPLTDIFIIDNGNQGIKEDREIAGTIESIYVPSEPQSVAASWNYLCRTIFHGHTHALILNDDIWLDRLEYEIYEYIKYWRGGDFFMSRKGFCSFIITKKCFKEIGLFDENFKGAYFEDNDYLIRMKLAKSRITETVILDPKIHNESSSIERNQCLNTNFENNAKYYADKWGGNRNGEKFLTPFNK